MKSLGQFLILMIASLLSTQSFAEMYTNVTATQVTLKSDVVKVKPLAATFKFGYRFAEALALEAQYGINASDDSYAGGDIEIDKLTALLLRMGGTTSYNGVRAYLLLGTSATEIKYTNVATPGETEFKGTTWGIGLEEFSQSVSNMAYVLEYVRYADDKDTKVTGISLGVRYNF